MSCFNTFVDCQILVVSSPAARLPLPAKALKVEVGLEPALVWMNNWITRARSYSTRNDLSLICSEEIYKCA